TRPAPDADGPSLSELAMKAGLATGQIASARPLAEGDASRCRSNTEAAARAFLVHLLASGDVPDAERTELARSRVGLLGEWGGEPTAFERLAPAHIESPLGRDFASYLNGAIAFYQGTFDDARRHFEALRESRQPWLQESGQYMVARTELNRAQQNAFGPGGYW